MLSHPLQRLQEQGYKAPFWVLFGLTVTCTVVLFIVDTPARTRAAPHGMLSFEFAERAEVLAFIVKSWSENTRLYVAFSLGLDYLYLCLYSSTLAIAALWATDLHPDETRTGLQTLSRLGPVAAWLAFAAAVFDGLENAALFNLLWPDTAPPWTRFALAFVLLKFATLASTLVYILSVVAYRLLKKPKKTL